MKSVFFSDIRGTLISGKETSEDFVTFARNLKRLKEIYNSDMLFSLVSSDNPKYALTVLKMLAPILDKCGIKFAHHFFDGKIYSPNGTKTELDFGKCKVDMIKRYINHLKETEGLDLVFYADDNELNGLIVSHSLNASGVSDYEVFKPEDGLKYLNSNIEELIMTKSQIESFSPQFH